MGRDSFCFSVRLFNRTCAPCITAKVEVFPLSYHTLTIWRTTFFSVPNGNVMTIFIFTVSINIKLMTILIKIIWVCLYIIIFINLNTSFFYLTDYFNTSKMWECVCAENGGKRSNIFRFGNYIVVTSFSFKVLYHQKFKLFLFTSKTLDNDLKCISTSVFECYFCSLESAMSSVNRFKNKVTAVTGRQTCRQTEINYLR